MSPVAKNITCKISKWLLSGGAIVILSGAVSFGISKANLSNRLDKNDSDHVSIKKDLDTLSAGREANAANISQLRIDIAEIRTDVKWIRRLHEKEINTSCTPDIDITATKTPKQDDKK